MSSSSSVSNNVGGFPLRANFFRSLPLTADKHKKLHVLAKQNATACLNQSFNDQWRYVPPEKDGTQLRKDTSNLATSCRLVRAATVLRCQEHEVNLVISNTNTESWREFMRKSFGKNYIDTMILHHVPATATAKDIGDEECASGSGSAGSSNALLRYGRSGSDPDTTDKASSLARSQFDDQSDSFNEEMQRASMWKKSSSCVNLLEDGRGRTSEASSYSAGGGNNQEEEQLNGVEEHMTIKWGAFDTGMSGKRDVCVIDYLSSAVIPNTDNEFVNLWCFTSVEGERVGCMELKDTHGVSRAKLTKLGVFWRAISEEETEVIICGSFPSKHAKAISSIFLSCLNKLQSIVEDLRLSNQIYIHRSTWVKDSERSNCHLCMRNFYALRRKHHCRKCGEVICSDCSLVENVDLPVIGYSKLRLCKVCCIKAKSTPLKKMEKANVFDHSVRARSLSNLNAPSTFTRSSYVEPRDNHDNNNNNNSKENGSADLSEHSSSFSSNNNNEYESPDSLEYRPGSGSNQSSNRSGVPHPEDFDDFIDGRYLKSQLTAMQEQRQQKGGSSASNSNMFDLLCELACQTLNCPIASVSIVDADGDGRRCIRSATGLDENPTLDEELQLFIGKIMGSTPSIVLDANLDKQVQQIFSRRAPPLIRFFAGCPIYSRTGKKLGYVCVADTTKRDTLGASCAFTMERLASLAVTTMERNVSKPSNQTEREHSAMIFDRPTTRGSGGSGSVSRVYEVHDDDIPMMVGSPVFTTTTTTAYAAHHYAAPAPVHQMPPRHQDYSSGYFEAQERMRKLLLKSYHTQQQLATGGAVQPQPPAHY
ncbi:TPA: hypothetical protein N0F65_004805 [Lagenidium giganteum]|uniref:FYVE-type domain-containing protein n=1 Tax=Lagenidium giganteum TaxID=4803 RepID=A0AAV2Z8N2_9STRA|nr:TPA: hypothetical protein N0F65_004805 [Lagenidium giganteum]